MRKKAKYIVDNFEDLIIAFFFVTMCFFVFIQIVSRYLFRAPLIYTDEAARYCYVWISFFGMAVATKLNNHIKIDVIDMALKGRAKAVKNILISLFSFGLYIILLVIGIDYTIFNAIQLSPAMEISKALIYVSLPLGAAFSIIRLFFLMKKDIKELLGR